MPARSNVVASLNARVGINTSNYERGAQRIASANRQLQMQQRTLRREIGRLNRDMERTVSQLRTTALQITAAGSAFLFGARRIADMGDELGKMSDRLNLSISELQSLQLAAESVGVPFEKAASAVSTLQVRIARLGLDTSSFRTELTALNPELLAQLEGIGNISEATSTYLAELRRVGQEQGRLAQLQLAQAGFGQGGAQGVLQVLDEQDTARRTLADAGVLLSERDRENLADVAQAFTDLGAVIRNRLIGVVSDLSDEIQDFVRVISGIVDSLLPLFFLVGGGFTVGSRLGAAGVSSFDYGRAFLRRRALNRAERDLASPDLRARARGQRAAAEVDARTPGGIRETTTATRGLLTLIPGLVGAGAGAGIYFDLRNSILTRRETGLASLNLSPDQISRLRGVIGNIGPGAVAQRDRIRTLAAELFSESEIQRARIEARENQPPGVGLESALDSALLRRLRDTYLFAFPPRADAGPEGDDARAQEERERVRATLGDTLLSDRRPVSGAAFSAAFSSELSRQRSALRRRRAAQARRAVSGPVGRDLGADFDLGGLGASFLEADQNRLRNLAQQRRLHQDTLELIERQSEEIVTGNERLKQVADTVRNSEQAFRAVFVDSIIEGRLQLEDFGGVLRQIAAQLIDLLAIQPLVSAAVGFVGGAIGGGTNYNPVVNPGPGGPAGYSAPAVAPVTAQQTNIVVNGVESQQAFENVATAVEQRLVPVITNHLAANANRPGAVRTIRGR